MDPRELIEAECARFGVPGAAVAVVAGGDVVLADGFGLRTATDPVTSRTLYMLASDTKCLAATTLCLLVEDGLLDLNEPVRSYLPWFEMHDQVATEQATCRDLLAHRTGLPRHSLMTIGDGDFRISNEDIARRLRYLQPSKGFRQGFGYSNVHYATAGHVAEVLTGRPWREFLVERVLQPAGMTGTTTYSPALTTGDFAAPHVLGARVPFQSRPYDLPSGGVVTHAEDLARWLLARLGAGSLSRTVLDMLQTPGVSTEGALPYPELTSMTYALGIMTAEYRGHRIQLHGGSQIGFSGQVVVLPDAGAGAAVVTNSHGSRLPLALGLGLVDQLLGLDPLPWGERLLGPPAAAPVDPVPETGPTRDLHEHAGTFHHPAYGDLVLDDQMSVAFHGLEGLRLLHVRDDQWLLTLGSLPEMRAPLSFRTDPRGDVDAVCLVVDPELPPQVFARR